MKKNINIYLYLLFSLLVAIVMYFVPMQADDYIYSFSYLSNNRIVNFSDAINSANLFYMNWSGRYFANLFTHLLLLAPHMLYCIMGFFVAFFTLWNIERLSQTHLYGILALSLLWIFCPDKNGTFYWITGFCNYGLVGCLVLCFLYYYQSNKVNAIIVLFAIFVALWHEAVALSVSGALLVDFLFNYKRRSLYQKLSCLAFFLGTCINIFSPGVFNRANIAASNMHNFSFYIQSIGISFLSLLDVFFLLLIFFKKKRIIASFQENSLVCCCLIFSLLLYIVLCFKTDIPANRYFYFTHLFCCILLLHELSFLNCFQRLSVLMISCGLIVLIMLFVELNMQIKNNELAAKDIRIIKNSTERVLPIDYIYLNEDSTFINNRLVAQYYHCKPFSAISSSLFYGLYLNNDNKKVKKFNEQWNVIEDKYYFRPLKNDENIKNIKVKWTKIIDLPIIKQKHFVSIPNASIFHCKDGREMLLIVNGKPKTKVINIE